MRGCMSGCGRSLALSLGCLCGGWFHNPLVWLMFWSDKFIWGDYVGPDGLTSFFPNLEIALSDFIPGMD